MFFNIPINGFYGIPTIKHKKFSNTGINDTQKYRQPYEKAYVILYLVYNNRNML